MHLASKCVFTSVGGVWITTLSGKYKLDFSAKLCTTGSVSLKMSTMKVAIQLYSPRKILGAVVFWEKLLGEKKTLIIQGESSNSEKEPLGEISTHWERRSSHQGSDVACHQGCGACFQGFRH